MSGLLLSSILVLTVTLAFFSPKWVNWKGLSVPDAWFDPHVNRAVDTLQQLANPWVHIKSTSNKVIENRLLFPVLGHYLGLSQQVFLAIIWRRPGT